MSGVSLLSSIYILHQASVQSDKLERKMLPVSNSNKVKFKVVVIRSLCNQWIKLAEWVKSWKPCDVVGPLRTLIMSESAQMSHLISKSIILMTAFGSDSRITFGVIFTLTVFFEVRFDLLGQTEKDLGWGHKNKKKYLSLI